MRQTVTVGTGRQFAITGSMKRQSVFPGTALQVGVDYTGGTNPAATTVLWTDITGTNNTWNPFTIHTASAYGTAITFFSRGGHTGTTGDVNAYFYIDAASMLDEGAGVLNGSMESGAATGVRDNWTGWTKSGSNAITFARASSNKADGLYSQYMARTDALTFTGAVYQTVPVTAGATYRLKAQMKRQGTVPAGGTTKFGYDLSGGSNPEGGSVVYTTLSTQDIWAAYNQTFTATGSTVTLFGYANQTSGSNNYYYLDAVILTRE